MHPPHAPLRNWLDELPLELSTRVAHFVRLAESTNWSSPSVLNLAEVSGKQRNAVVAAFNYQLTFPMEDGQRWAQVFRTGLRQLQTDCFVNESVCQLLRSPTLLSASIPNLSAYLESLSKASALKSLSIEFADRSPMEPYIHSIHILLNTLKALDLQHLRFKCVGICIFNDVLRSREAWLELAGLCPNLLTFSFFCSCSSLEVELSPFFNSLPSLRFLTFNRPISKRTRKCLQRMESVSLQHMWDGGMSMQEQCELAVKIGEPVRGIRSTFFPLYTRPSLVTEEGLKSLSICYRLTELDMHLTVGAENSFPILPELTSLRLRWEVSSAGDLHGQRPQFHSPSVGFFKHVGNMALNLRTICFFNIRISLNEISDMLSRTGPNLEVFGTSIIGQKEPPQQRISDVLDILGRENHSLKRLDIFGYPHLQKSDSTESFCACWRGRIFRSLNILQRRSTAFDNRELVQFINKWLYYA